MAKKSTSQKKSSKPTSGRREKAGPRLYTLDVVLIGGPVSEAFVEENPVVGRTIQIRGDQTLMHLHFAIFKAFGREDEHMYEFQFGKKPMERDAPRYVMPMIAEEHDESIAGIVDEATIDSLELHPRQVFFYWFDYGDDWWHKIRVASIDNEVPPGKYPRVIKQEGKSPPQYPEMDEQEDFDDNEDDDDEE